jgi:thiamine biosynthesis lipoprotein
MAVLKLARHAMATRFELVLYGDNPVSLRAAGEEALDEIERLESQLSLFKPTSEIAHLNARAASGPVRVTPSVFGLLQHAQRLSEETRGAFDITIAPLVRCWGFMGGTGHLPRPEELAAARAKVGMHLVRLDQNEFSVRFDQGGVMLDLGAIGKGYAIERAVELLRDAGVTSALVHGGTSTIYGLGHPPDADFWKIEIPSPITLEIPASNRPFTALTPRDNALSQVAAMETRTAAGSVPFATVALRDASLSVSAVWGKFFQAQGRNFGHIIDPRSGEPSSAAVMAAVALPSATETDALSTALLTLGPAGHDHIAHLRSEIRTLVVAKSNGKLEIESNGITIEPFA